MKMQLKDLKVNSFVTNQETVKGGLKDIFGSGDPGCGNYTIYPVCQIA